jgi:tryptophan halogenase
MDIPDSLRHKLDLFRDGGRVFRFQDELFTENSWLAVMFGQVGLPRTYDPVADGIPSNEMRRAILELRTALLATAQALPAHGAFIQSYCRAEGTPMPVGATAGTAGAQSRPGIMHESGSLK